MAYIVLHLRGLWKLERKTTHTLQNMQGTYVDQPSYSGIAVWFAAFSILLKCG